MIFPCPNQKSSSCLKIMMTKDAVLSMTTSSENSFVCRSGGHTFPLTHYLSWMFSNVGAISAAPSCAV